MRSKPLQEAAVPAKVYCTISINGIQCPVTNMFDIDGDALLDTSTLDMVCSVVAQLPNGQWVSTTANHTELWPLQ
jgi:hypothetical protein